MHGIAPVSDMDLFGSDVLADPYPAYEKLREAGPAVMLERYGVWGFARHDVVRRALLDHETFYSSAGTGLTDLRKESSWRSRSQLQEADPPDHARAHSVVGSVFSPAAVRTLREPWFKAADELVLECVAAGEIDGIARLAQAMPLRVFADALGIPEEGREEHLPAFAELAFNLNGPDNELFRQAMNSARSVMPWIVEHLYPEKLSPGGWGAQIHRLARTEGFGREEAAVLVRGILAAGMDTTMKGLGSLLWCLATHPDQYDALRADPRLTRPAFDEAVRLESPIQLFFRTVARDVDVEGLTVPAGDRVVLLFGAANRDPRRWEDPDRFDVSRKSGGHLGFGAGLHACIGRMVAYAQAEAMMTALARHCATVELTAPPRWRPNNTIRGLAALPLRLTTAAR
ncbi:cytochrome P450 [Streptomyces sp. SID10853]|uniref:cytochrome P450 n=1 Tax=Streptomyces sp. SID10853 TaxID=2706028 RepID=UPI0013C15A94|nr:cytochrome P450 [Streptomyces sp. SID10853]NDZ79368.1 cytochrome P450 [Streptomyces sp. SID10853]